MKVSRAKYLIFIIVFCYVSLWSQINLWISSLGQEKVPISVINDSKITQVLENRTGVNIESIKISESNLLFAMMIGIPENPQLVLSRNLYETFTENELEYVLLHEAGHYVLWHGIKELVLGILFISIGVTTLYNLNLRLSGVWFALLFAVTFGILMIQYGRYSEIKADTYALQRISNPQGMIEATTRFKQANEYASSKYEIARRLFERKNPYANRIRMAKEVLLIENNK